MKRTKSLVAASLAVAALAAAWGLQAQQPGFTRTLLQKLDSSAQGREIVQAKAEFVPGGAAGKHTHPGEEIGYILQGTLQLEVEGKPPVALNAGDFFSVPAGTVHDGKNIASGNTIVLATYVVEKGQPLATPVK